MECSARARAWNIRGTRDEGTYPNKPVLLMLTEPTASVPRPYEVHSAPMYQQLTIK